MRALIEDDINRYPKSQVAEIQKCLEDIPIEDIRKNVYALVKKGILDHSPGKTYRKYWLAKKNGNEIENIDRES